MVNLIITLISIALIAIVAVAALYNGGDAFRQGSANASAAQLVNAGQQISAANELYALNNNGAYPSDISLLTNNNAYLSSLPKIPDGFQIETTMPFATLNANVVTIPMNVEDREEVCLKVNEKAGYVNDTIPLFSSAPTDIMDKTFGCLIDGTLPGSPIVFYFSTSSFQVIYDKLASLNPVESA